MKRFVFFIILFLLFLLQFVYFPFGGSYFEIPKVYVAETGIFLLLLLQIFRGKIHRRYYDKSLLICCGLIIILSISGLVFHTTPFTFWGNQFRMQGTFLLWLLLVFSLLSSIVPIKRISWIFFLVVLLGQCLLAFIVDSGTLGRAVGNLAEPNSLAGEMLFVWPFLFFSVNDTKRRWVLFVVSFFIVGLTVLLSGSRSGMIGFFLQFVFIIMREIFRLPFGKVTLVCLGLLLLSYGLPFVEKSSLYENRTEVWQSAFIAGMYHPIQGSGFGNAEVVLHKASLQLYNHLQGYYVDSSHNIFFDWFVQGGIVGFALFCFLLGKTILRFAKEKMSRNMLVLLGLLGTLSFNPVSVCLLVAFWWVVGQGFTKSEY
jgi:O-antigen ligase